MIGSRERESGGGFDALASDLVWPRLVHAPAMAWRPGRLVLAYLACAIMVLVGWSWGADGDAGVWGRVGQAAHNGGRAVLIGVVDRDASAVRFGFERVLGIVPKLMRERTVSASVTFVVSAVVLVVVGGAIARSAAGQFGLGLLLSVQSTLAWAVRRSAQTAAALIAAPVLAGILLLVVAAVGWAGFTISDVLGGLLFGPCAILACFAVFVLALWATGLPMTVGAMACEDSDGLDAAQRVLAYVLHRPLRYAWYVVVLGVLGAAMVLAASWIIERSVGVCAGAMGAWIGDDESLRAMRNAAEGDGAPSVVSFWTGALRLVPHAIALSYFFSAGSVLYLSMRRVADGHEPADLWPRGVNERDG